MWVIRFGFSEAQRQKKKKKGDESKGRVTVPTPILVYLCPTVGLRVFR